MPTVFAVTNTLDDGSVGTLRWAITEANGNVGLDEVHFGIPGGGVQTITPSSALPAITDPVVIDGYTQPGASPNTLSIGSDAVLQIELTPGVGGIANGLNLQSSDSVVRGLVINRFSSNGVVITGSGATGNVISGNYIGTDQLGTTDLGNAGVGVLISGGASGNRIGTDGNGFEDAAERNLVSGNDLDGVRITGPATDSNVIAGNYVGVNAAGVAAVPNGQGVEILAEAKFNRIGSDSSNDPYNASERNIISGNRAQGVEILNAGSTGNLIAGNYVGTNADGSSGLQNGGNGVRVRANANTIGGSTAAARNVVSGNSNPQVFSNIFNGIVIQGDRNVVIGNYVGTDATGNYAIANANVGILVNSNAAPDGSANDNQIGGPTAGERNLVSGNGDWGIVFQHAPTTGNIAQGNWIGLNATGTGTIPGHALAGIGFLPPITTTLGNSAIDNVISGNSGPGVLILSATKTVVQGNRIGTDPDGNGNPLFGNQGPGIQISSGARDNTIGGTAIAARNVISGNVGAGVLISGAGTATNVVQGNYIGANTAARLDQLAGAISWWRGEGDASDALGTNNGTLENGATFAAGKVGQAFSFDGIDDFIQVPNAANLQIHSSSPSTIENWVMMRSQPANTWIPLTPAKPFYYGLLYHTGLERFRAAVHNGTRWRFLDIPFTLQSNRLYHIAQTWSGHRLRVYVDGVLISTSEPANGFVESGELPLYIGKWDLNPVRNDVARLDGIMDEPAIYDREILPGELHAIYAADSIGKGTSLPIGGDGIRIENGATDNTIGGTANGEGNTITSNMGNGVLVTGETTNRNPIRGNMIHSNAALGIDLTNGAGDGPTANDLLALDADTGANQVQNYPELSAVQTSTVTHVVGSLDSAPNTTFALDFYANSEPDPSGFGEGQRYLGSGLVSTNSAGIGNFDSATFTIPLGASTPGEWITATATDPDGNTSEFSEAFHSLFTGIEVDPDGCGPGMPALLVGGTPDNDVIIVSAVSGPGNVKVTLNGVDHGTFLGVSCIEVYGQAGNDQLSVTSNVMVPALIDGGDGDDTLVSGEGPATLLGGAGIDTIYAGKGDDYADGGEDNDVIEGEDGNDTLFGGGGDDTIKGGNHNDVIDAGEGNNYVEGGDGNDTITAGAGDDHILAGKDNDWVNAGDGTNTVYGEDGHDTIYTGSGTDHIYAGKGNDFVDAGAGNDTIEGNDDYDILLGGGGDDTLDGGKHRDLLIGGVGGDGLVGGDKDDLLIAGTTAFDADAAALNAILAEWMSSRSYAARVANLLGTGTGTDFANRLNGGYFLLTISPGATVFDDEDVDTLTGSADRDWFFANLEDSGMLDVIIGLESDELTEDLEVMSPP